MIKRKFLVMLFLVIITIPINEMTRINYTSEAWGGGYNNSIYIKYCGMNSNTHFSISTDVYDRNAVNLFYPVNIGTFTHKKTDVQVLEVNPKYLKVNISNPWYK